MEITQQRREVFLKTLAGTGSVAAAVMAASVHLDSSETYEKTGDVPGRSSFYSLRKRDIVFAQAWDAALSEALASVEEMLMKNAMNPPEWPVTNRQGDVVGMRRDSNSQNRLLLRVASRLDPAAWAERREAHLQIDHNTNSDLQLSHADVLALGPADQAELLRILEVIATKKDDPNLIHEQHQLIEEAPDDKPE